MTLTRRRVTAVLLIVFVLLYVIVFSALSIARYNTFHAATFDLGYFSQVVWNTAQGRWFETSVSRSTNVELIGNYLGEHAALILFPLAFLYRLWPDPRLLLILQSIALGIAAIPLYWIGRRKTNNPLAALMVACGYLVYPALGFVNLFDFHPIALSIPLVFFAAWALMEERRVTFWVFVVLALLVQEEMVIPLAAWGLVNLLQWQRRRTGLGISVLAGLWAVACFAIIIPAFNEGQPFKFWQLWQQLPGLASQSSAQGGVAQPTAPASPQAIALFLIHLFLPLGFLPFLGWSSFVVAAPTLTYLLLGERAALHSVGYQYPAAIIPWLFLAALEGLGRLNQWANRSSGLRFFRLGLAFLATGTLGTNLVLNPVFLYAQSGAFRSDPYQAQIEEALAQIPAGAGVAVVNRLGPPLANRQVLVALEYPPPLRLDHVQMADYVLLDLVDCRTVPTSDQRAGYANIVTRVLQTEHFRVRYWADRILLLEHGTPSEKDTQAILTSVSDLVKQNRPCWP